MTIASNLKAIQSSLPKEVTLVAVSKTKPNTAILEAYQAGQRIFGVESALNQAEEFENINIVGLMGMATFTDENQQIADEFKNLKKVFDSIKNDQITTLSMGMSGDYNLAIEQGSTMVRVGSAIFGHRNK